MQLANSIGFRGEKKILVAFLENCIQNPIDDFDPNDPNEVIKSHNFQYGDDDDIATVAWGCLAGFPDNESLSYVRYDELLQRRFELAPELEVVTYMICLEDIAGAGTPFDLKTWADTTPEDWYADLCEYDEDGCLEPYEFTQENHELAKSLIKHGIIFFEEFDSSCISYYRAGSVDYDCSYPNRNMKTISDILKGADSIDSDTGEWIISENKLMRYLGSKTRVLVPKGITVIGCCAFKNNSDIISIILPDGLTNIENMAFGYCPSLASLTLPASIEKISDSAFDFNDDLIIHASIGSYAEQYAKDHDIKFEGI